MTQLSDLFKGLDQLETWKNEEEAKKAEGTIWNVCNSDLAAPVRMDYLEQWVAELKAEGKKT